MTLKEIIYISFGQNHELYVMFLNQENMIVTWMAPRPHVAKLLSVRPIQDRIRDRIRRHPAITSFNNGYRTITFFLFLLREQKKSIYAGAK